MYKRQGHHSTEELGAASFVNNLFTLCIIFSTGFSYGLTPVVGGFYGNRRFAEAGQALRCSLVANVLVALLLTLVMAVLYFNVERLGQPGELLPLIKPYYLVLLASLVFVMLFNGFKQFTDGITDTKTAMWILLGGNALNIVGKMCIRDRDIPGKSQFRKFLASGMSDDKTIVISTHQVRDIDKVLDHVLIMDNSRVLLDESTASICSKLFFLESDDRELAATALYTLPSVQGNFLMLPNTEGEESEINLELLFGAVLAEPGKIAEMFHTKTNE